MALMKRANREIIVPEHLAGEYLDKGYSLIDDKGTILKDSNPQNVEDFRSLVAHLKDRIAGLESHEESLTKENVELKSELDALRASAPAETKKSPGKMKEA